jgi:DNA-binding CsgD family transcriptional regulator
LSNLGAAAISLNDYRRALPYMEESLAIRRELGDTWGVALSLNNLGAASVYLKDYHNAFNYHRQSLAIRRGLGDKWGTAVSLANMAQVAFFLGSHDEAYDLSRESLALRLELDDKLGIAVALEAFARIAAAQKQFELAARLIGAAACLRDKFNLPLEPYDLEDYDRLLALIKAELPSRVFEIAWEEGRSLSLPQPIELTRQVKRPQSSGVTATSPGGLAASPEEKQPVAVPAEIPAPTLTGAPTSPRKAAKQAFGGLTDRERNVAALIAQGKSNRLIAQELFVSERTVEKHVENILSKLQFISRAQIAAWSVEKGLTKNLSSEPV